MFGDNDELFRILRPFDFITDISWTIEICLNFISADHTHRTFKDIALNYLKFYFWIDAIATFPNLLTMEQNESLMALKLLRIFHLMDLFKPIRLLLEHVFMRNYITQQINNVYSLITLFTGVWLFAHFCACIWIILGTRDDDSWINSRMAENYDGVWADYGAYELYVVSLYWIFEVLTTVGYGDFSGSTIPEMLFSMFLEFGGLLFFSILTGLMVSYLSTGTNFN